MGTFAIIGALSISCVAVAGAQVPKAYAPDFGSEAPLIANSSQILATYYGWENTTVFGHQIYALTGSEYLTDLNNGCFNFYVIFRTGCAGPGGTDLGAFEGLALLHFDKPQGVTTDPYLVDPPAPPPPSFAFSWTPGTEIILALMVNQGVDPVIGGNDVNWFFSGDPSRNTDGLAHLAFFSPVEFPDGVPGNRGIGIIGNTQGKSLYGFEDVNYTDSDWDFNNAIFALDDNSVSPPAEVTPEPGTLALLASGLAGLGLAGRRRRRGGTPVT